MIVIKVVFLVCTIVLFLSSAYYFIKSQSFIKPGNNKTMKDILPLLLLFSSTYSSEGHRYYGWFVGSLFCSILLGGVLVLLNMM